MAGISDIVSVSISADSRTPSRTGFGTPLIMTYHTRFVDQYRTYSTLAEMAADGFVTYDDAYRMAAAVFSQNPCPKQVVVGRLPAAPTFVTRLTMTNATEGAIVKATVVQPATGTETELSYTVGAAETTSTVATAFELLTEAVTGVNSTASTANVDVTPAVAGRKVHIHSLQNCTIEETTADAGYDDELTSLQIENDDWYGVLIDSCSEANVDLVAAWTLAQKKLFFVGVDTSGLLDNTETMAEQLKDASNDRTVFLYNSKSTEFGGARWMGMGFARTPGSITWAFKPLLGLTAKTLTTTQKTNLETDNVNHYQSLASLPITRPGKVVSGEWIDIRHGLDALEARIKEDVFALLANADKVPFTAAGLKLIENAILGALKAFEGSPNEPGLITEGTSYVLMPDIADITSAERAARTLTGVRFGGDLEGAVHAVSMVGSLST